MASLTERHRMLPTTTPPLYIGLMSGTSLDGVDAVLATFSQDLSLYSKGMKFLAAAHIPFSAALRADLLALQAPGDNELHREALVANVLAGIYAQCVEQVLDEAAITPDLVRAIGAHGQTIRHQPELGYTRQANNAALLAELSGIDVIADFRSRDIAAGGQGAPLVPAFHQALFVNAQETRVVLNIGGISNVSVLHGERVLGFDTGPGNVLMDGWVARHLGAAYDADGVWASSGNVLPDLLGALLAEPFFSLAPPKSTGRDLFHLEWLDATLTHFPPLAPADVQATLSALTATSIIQAVQQHAAGTQAIYVCGGGAYNSDLLARMRRLLHERDAAARVLSTEALGVSPNHVEAFAFAWLAHRFCERQTGSLAAVTGARGARILGALYPAR